MGTDSMPLTKKDALTATLSAMAARLDTTSLSSLVV
jgi:hypothetical protein